MRLHHTRTAACAVTLVLALAGCSDDADSDSDGDGSGASPASLDEAGRRIELGPTELTVMSFNIWLGGELVDVGQVAEAIKASGADVVGLQESDGNVRRIAELVGWPHADEQLQVISRYPLISPPDGDFAYVQLAPGQVVAIANTHLTSDPYGPYLVRDGATLDEVLANEHETRVPEVDERAAGWQPAIDAGIPLFLTGDFNAPSHRDWTDEMVDERAQIRYAVDWPVSRAVEQIGFVDTYREAHPDPASAPGITWTFGYPYPRLADDEAVDRIDFVYVAGAEEVVDSGLVGPTGVGDVTIGIDPYPSDHLGVVSTVVVDPVEPPVFVAADEVRTEIGDPLGIYYHAPGGLDTDQIALVPAGGDPATDGFAALDTAEASFFGRIALGTAGQPPGAYEAVLSTVDDDGDPVEVSRSPFWLVTPGARPSLAVGSEEVAAGEPIDVRWDDAFARKWDWIGIFPADDPLLYNYYAFTYTGASVTGSYTFGPDDIGEEMLPAGEWVARLMSDDSYVALAEARFTVTEG